jgi:hypothetical protein
MKVSHDMEVRVDEAPDGRPSLVMDNGAITAHLTPEEARHLAEALLTRAREYEEKKATYNLRFWNA